MAYVQSAKAYGTGSTVSVTLNGVTAGNLVVVHAVKYGGNTSGHSVNDTTGSNTYVEVSGAVTTYSGDSAMHMDTWYSRVAVGGNLTIRHIDSGAPSVSLFVAEYDNIPSGPLDVTAVAQATSGTAVSSGNTGTTSQADELIVGVMGNYSGVNGPTIAAGSGYTLRQSYTDGTQFMCGAIEDKTVSSTGTQAATFTQGSSVGWMCRVITFKMNAGGTAVNQSDSGTRTETATISATIPGSDSATRTETSSIAATLGGSESGSVSDSGSVSAAIPGSDSASATETSAVRLAVADSASATETATPEASVSGNDSATATEGSLIALSVVADFGTFVETASLVVAITQSDSATATESGSVGGSSSPTSSDSGTATETASIVVSVSASDSATATDSRSLAVAISLSDAGVASESQATAATVNGSDSGAASDTGAISGSGSVSVNDSATATESFTITVVVSSTDSATATESITSTCAITVTDGGLVVEGWSGAATFSAADAGVAVEAWTVSSSSGSGPRDTLIRHVEITQRLSRTASITQHRRDDVHITRIKTNHVEL